MAYTTFGYDAGSASPVDGVERAVHALVHRAFSPLRRIAKHRQLTRELDGLSTRELAELRLARHDIDRVAREGAREV